MSALIYFVSALIIRHGNTESITYRAAATEPGQDTSSKSVQARDAQVWPAETGHARGH